MAGHMYWCEETAADADFAGELADRALHLVTTTLRVTKDWTSSCYLLEIMGPSSCVMRRTSFLDRSEEYIFRNTIRAVCWVQLQDGAIVVRSEDDKQAVEIKLNYKLLPDSVAFGLPTHTMNQKGIKKKNPNPGSPTSVIPDESPPIPVVRPLAMKPIPNVFW
jgi:hypothetical protein